MAVTNRKNTCKNCLFWVNDKRHMKPDEGYCHRYPPTVTWSDSENPFFFGWKSHQPPTEPTTWCGEWSKK